MFKSLVHHESVGTPLLNSYPSIQNNPQIQLLLEHFQTQIYHPLQSLNEMSGAVHQFSQVVLILFL